MNLNQVLMKFFHLPPAVMLLLAVAGFSGLASVIYFVLPALRTPQGRFWILVVGGIALVIFALLWGLRRLFFGKKTARLAGELESQGPTRGDIAEQEQIYREKFRAKLAELKSNGLSVYKLPWFVLMGEPGCGKTASLIHSGLDFPLGKDEVPGFGGTRNYNWWFTNEAVILDTAGRIAFQEEGTTDKVEWEYFLKLLRRNRPRCPINGVIIALPADKLLRDTADERAQKAAILRERLRQIHQGLGVRFPTFVLVTKMDLVGGFSEFFEEVRVDLQQRNQMFGWSRPGEFQKPFDPATFPEAFETVYRRLRDWAMRYLQRKATDEELGLIVTFPESFKQLGPALNDYICTIFQKSPLLEPPFFRGFYFTSAVQEGAPIFDVLARTHPGLAISERAPKAVDSKAFFIHDFYAKKVFPEHGLVFRSAKHVTLNRRMRRLVWAGSAAMAVLMLAFFGFGYTGVRSLVTNPRDDCAAATEQILKREVAFKDLPGSLAIAKRLAEHYRRYDAPGAWLYAKLLFIGASITEPKDHVGQIHARYVLECILRPVLRELEDRLAAEKPAATASPEQRRRFLDALRVYAGWYGEIVQQAGLKQLNPQEAAQRRAEFDALLAYLGLADQDRRDAADQFELALKSLARQSRSFAREIVRDTLAFDVARGRDVLIAGVREIVRSWEPRTKVASDSTNPWVRFWSNFAEQVGTLRERYDLMLSLREKLAGDEYETAVEQYLSLTRGLEGLGSADLTPETGTLNEAYFGLMRFLRENADQVPARDGLIVRLAALLSDFERQWNAELDPIEKALQQGAPDASGAMVSDVYTAIRDGRKRLSDAVLFSMNTIRARLGVDKDREPLDELANAGLIELIEARPPEPFEGTPTIRLARGALGPQDVLRTYLLELRDMVAGDAQQAEALRDLRRWPELLNRFAAQSPAGPATSNWFSSVEARKAGFNIDDVILEASGLKARPFWRPVALFNLARSMTEARQKHIAGRTLETMIELAEAATRAPDLTGLGRLIPDFDGPEEHLPFVANRFNSDQPPAAAPPAARQESPGPEPQPEDDSGGLRRVRRPVRADQASESADASADELRAPGRRRGEPQLKPLMVRYHTREHLLQTLRALEQVRAVLEKREGGKRVLQALDLAADRYIDRYFLDWHGILSDPKKLLDEGTLTILEKCSRGEVGWPEFVAIVADRNATYPGDLALRMEAVIREALRYHDLLADKPEDAAVEERIIARLKALHREGKSLPNTYLDVFRLEPVERGPVEQFLAARVVRAWQAYTSAVRVIGPLDGDQRAGGPPPDVDALAEGLTYPPAIRADFPAVAPLLDLAGYGRQLLAHHVAGQLAGVFAACSGYPISGAGGAALSPDRFIEFLRTVQDFRDRYGTLLTELRSGDETIRAIFSRCDEWVAFLYGENRHELRNSSFRLQPIAVDIAVVAAQGTLNAGSNYNKFTLTLPLLYNARPADPIVFDTRGDLPRMNAFDALQESVRKSGYAWSLTAEGGDRRITIVLSERNQASALPETLSKSLDLPPNPWAVLMSIGATNDDRTFLLPIRIDTGRGGEQVGFDVALRFARRVPGTIPIFSGVGARPAMAAATRYLQ